MKTRCFLQYLGIIAKTYTQNPKIFILKPKTQKLLYPKPKPKTQKLLYPKPKPKTPKNLYPNPKPKPKT